MPPVLTLRRRPTPPVDQLGPQLTAILGPHLRANLPLHDVALFDVVDHTGAHRYDLCLYRGEDGAVYLPGTLEVVAAFSQMSACESDDEALLEALDQALLDAVRAGLTI